MADAAALCDSLPAHHSRTADPADVGQTRREGREGYRGRTGGLRIRVVACAQRASGETRIFEMPGCSSSSRETAEAARCQDPKHQVTMKRWKHASKIKEI